MNFQKPFHFASFKQTPIDFASTSFVDCIPTLFRDRSLLYPLPSPNSLCFHQPHGLHSNTL
ncbi:Uncharacterized protein APZ42_000088 [Daphnia magna]|uniref:Uncharacterized protein n=1 Tax=Daphnia magna TaxID=35525 RepID=A0A164JXG3_9CRUS|nr:Uncharacterized protein APZ42_000088 [Daphnia magna]